MSQFNIDEIEKRTLSGLKDFQRATVERVDYLFRHNQNRVLVADEVGMGKTLIARGAIVKTARLRIEEKDDLFKVIYICSNQNIANQNIRKLNVTGKNAIGSVSDTRLSMQHLKITEQENDPQIKEGFIQLIPLTPETSFRMTTGGGSVQERALMYAILRRMPDFKGHVTSLEKFMIMDAVKAWDGWAKWNFENRVAECEKMTKGVYPQNVIEKILNYQEYESIRDMLLNHLHERRYNKQLTYSNYYVMNKLRVMFARISVSMLEPDLVIMDEFQRFKFLLSSDDSELGILAHSFLSGHDTRVLLLRLCAEYQLFAAMPLFPRSGITRRQAALRTDHPQRGNRFEALRGMRQHVCGGQQPGEILPRLRGKDTPQTESPKREKQAFTDKNNYIASTANEYPFARNARASHRERGHFACWDSPKPLYDRERT